MSALGRGVIRGMISSSCARKLPGCGRDADDVRAGDDRPVNVDGVAGVRNEDSIARVENGETEVSDALFGANGDDGLGVGVEIDVVARLVPVADALRRRGMPRETE